MSLCFSLCVFLLFKQNKSLKKPLPSKQSKAWPSKINEFTTLVFYLSAVETPTGLKKLVLQEEILKLLFAFKEGENLRPTKFC